MSPRRQAATNSGATDTRLSSPEQLQATRSGVLALSGWGLNVRVRRRRLVVADGLGPRRREGAFFRASSPIKRLVLIGRSGSVTLEAIAWLNDTRAALIHLDWDGTVLLASAAWRSDDGRLRRQQALATTNGTGIAIARELVAAKLRGQRDVLLERGKSRGGDHDPRDPARRSR